MSARDDAAKRTTAPPPPRAGRRVGTAVLAGALLGFGLAAVLVQHVAPGRWPRYEMQVAWEGGPPTPAEWPRAARPGEDARCVQRDGRTLLAVRSVRSEDTRALASALQRRRLSGVDAGAARRAAVRAQWRAGRSPEPEPALSAAARTAALVRGRLLLVMLLDPRVKAAAPPSSPAIDGARARLDAAGAEVVRLALAAQPDALEQALTACAAAEGAWLRTVAANPALASRAGLEAAWRWHERSRAPVLDGIERRIEARLSKAEQVLVPPVAFERALRLERLAPDPAAILFVGGRWDGGVEPSPIARTWVMLLGAGALAGALAGLALTVPRPRRRARRDSPRLVRGMPPGLSVNLAGPQAPWLSRDSRAAWRTELGWLHVVSGPDRARVAHAVATIAAVFVGRGERVLALDAGQDLRLHERFGGDTRWGLGECLAGEVPLLGAVQAAGRPGFHFLACGESGVGGRWEAMSRLLEEARQHFDRVILALGVGTPSAAALPLGGRVLEAWWAEPRPELPKRAIALSERLGVSFVGLNLDGLTEGAREGAGPLPEGADGSAQTAVSPEPVEGEAAPVETKGGVREAVLEATPAAASRPPDDVPPVLACDPDVQDRLRFLLWMRRVRAERHSTPVGVGTDG